MRKAAFSLFFVLLICNFSFAANIIYSGGNDALGPGNYIGKDIFEHDGKHYRKGVNMGSFSLSGY